MELYYFHDPHGNFGDDLNQWIWDGLLPGWREAWPGQLLIGVGTLINTKLPRGPGKVIIGSGVGYGPLPDPELMAECRFFSVRGPRSAAALGLPADRGIIDPAIMLPDFPEFQGIAKSGPPIFVPHHYSVDRHDWKALCAAAGVDFVSPCDDARAVIRRLAAAPLVLAESMHAAIIADAFGTPWQPVVVSHTFLPSKWLDWADSLGISLDFPPIEPVSQRLRSLISKAEIPASESLGSSRGEAAAPPVATGGPRVPLRTRLRRVGRQPALLVERALLPRALARLAAGPGQFSERVRMEATKARYRAVLDEVREGFKSPVRQEQD